MKVLVSSYACEPGKGSEPGVGWNWARQAARSHEVWVLTRANNRGVIEAELASIPQPNLHFIYFDLPRWARWLKKHGGGIRLYNYFWELLAVLPARRAHGEVDFDVMHHVTMNSIETPGLFWLLGTPFVWGPVGGAQESPKELKNYFGDAWRGEQARAARKNLLRFNPIVRGAISRAALVLAANADTERALRSLGAGRVQRELETAVYALEAVPDRRGKASDPLRVLWVGGIVPRKAPLLALDAMEAALRRGVRCNLTIVGDGPLRDEVLERVSASGLDGQVEVLGQVPYGMVRELFRAADVLLFTSLNDTSGNVVLEGMSMGLPVVALDHHGASEILADGAGLLVPVGTPDQVVQGLSAALAQLAASPDLRRSVGNRARERISLLYTWDSKGDLLETLYSEVVGMKV